MVYRVWVMALIIIYAKPIHGQYESNLWLFSPNEVVDFSSGEPVVRYEDDLNTRKAENGFTLGDQQGNIVLYTDSRNVLNRDFEFMYDGMDIGGDRSSSQGVVCVYDSSDSNILHLFVTYQSLYHVMIDMSLQSGKGDVVSSELVWAGTTEHLTAYPHPCGGIWIITHESDGSRKFISFLYRDGMIHDPVYSEIGFPVIEGVVFFRSGSMEINKSGDILAASTYNDYLGFYWFDKLQGSITELRDISVPTSSNTGSRYYTGVFSENDEFFYTPRMNDDRDSTYIIQIDVKTLQNYPYEETIVATIENFVPGKGFNRIGINRASNGKIYFCLQSGHHFNSIENPNLKGDQCNVNYSKFLLKPNTRPIPNEESRRDLVLGNLVHFKNKGIEFSLPEDTSLCYGMGINLDLSTIEGEIIWNDGFNGKSRYIESSGDYIATFFNENGCELKDTFTLSQLEPEMSLIDTFICEGSYVSHNDIEYFGGESYYDSIYLDGCLEIIQTQIKTWDSGFNSDFLPDDTLLCPDQGLILDLSHINGIFSWWDGNDAKTTTISESGRYWLSIRDFQDCTYSDSIDVNILKDDHVFIDTILCIGEEISLNSLIIDKPGIFADTVFLESGCELVTELEVKVDSSSMVYDTLYINLKPTEKYEWNNQIYSAEGLFSYEYINASGCSVTEYLSVSIDAHTEFLHIPNIISPNDDGINDQLKIVSTSTKKIIPESFRIYDRWGNAIFNTSENDLESILWNGNYGSAIASSGVYTYILIFRIEGQSNILYKTGNITVVR
jgi:gliding motility-associated-like protein